MSLFSRLFGGRSSEPDPAPESYKGFAITPTPIQEESGYRLSARIVPESGDGAAETIVRADTLTDLEAAKAASVEKAKKVIDERQVPRPGG